MASLVGPNNVEGGNLGEGPGEIGAMKSSNRINREFLKRRHLACISPAAESAGWKPALQLRPVFPGRARVEPSTLTNEGSGLRQPSSWLTVSRQVPIRSISSYPEGI